MKQGMGVLFSKFIKKGGGSDFSHKKGGVGKIRGALFSHYPFLMSSFSGVCGMCVLCSFTQILSVFFVSHRK